MKPHSWGQVSLLGSCVPVKGLNERNVIMIHIFAVRVIEQREKFLHFIMDSFFCYVSYRQEKCKDHFSLSSIACTSNI